MTNEEARASILTYCIESCDMVDSCTFEDLTCVEAVAIAALDKQIPKKPKQDDCAENIFYCPNCTRWFNGYHKPHHCKCGQAIDWSEE